MKRTIKHLLFGTGWSIRTIKLGLLKGLRFGINPANKTQRLLGTDELEIAAIVRKFAARARIAVDIGANDGWYTLYFCTSGSVELVIACEPEAQFVELLKANLEANRSALRAEYRVVDRFIGTAAGQMAVDEVLKETEVSVLLKIDVDGGELEVLRSAERTLASRRALLIIETHSTELERDCIRFLEERNYRCTVIPNAWYRLFIPELRPIPHNRWFFAEPK